MSETIRRALVTGGTRNDTAPMAVFAMNIKETNRDLFDEIVFFHDGIKKTDQELIKDIFPSRFLRYQYPDKSKNDIVLSYFSEMVFCKYECFRLLDDYDEVVWSDYDVVVLSSLKDFCQDTGNSLHALSSKANIQSMFYKDIRSKEVLGFDLNKEAIGTPLFKINRSITNHNEIVKWCYQKTREWDEDLYLPEQCIFALAVQKFEISVKRFDFDTYACYPTKYSGNEIILHAAGQPKFWNGMPNDTWNRLYNEWLKMGGSRYRDGLKKMKRLSRFITARLKGIRGRDH